MKPERIEALMERALMVAGRYPAGSFVDVSLEPAELLHLLRCARAWAELQRLNSIEADALGHGGWGVQVTTVCTPHGWVEGPDLLTATEAALARAKETTQ